MALNEAVHVAYLATYKTTRARYDAQLSRLWTDRSSFDAHWQDIADVMRPTRVRFWAGERNRGEKKHHNIIDSTAAFAWRTLASGLHAGLTSPARPWMKLSTPDPELAAFGPVKAWLHVVTQRMLTVFAQTNLYNVLPLVYGDMGGFGTGAMSVVEDEQDLFRCYSYPVGSYALGMNARGIATVFARKYEYTVRQVIEEFGVRRGYTDIDWSRISSAVKSQWLQGNYEAPVPIGWLVQPNEGARVDLPWARYAPWTSCWFELGGTGEGAPTQFLRESGFRTFPILAPRWDITGEDSYGTDCPGMMALGDVRQLQIMARRKGQLLAKAVDPPLKGPSTLRTQKTSLFPGDITYVDLREGQQGLSPIHEVRLEGYQHLVADMADVRYMIRRAFYEDLFLMLTQSDDRLGADRPTAREIAERHEEKLLALGPVLERTNDELLNPLVDRTYALMVAAGLVPEAPPDLHGVKLKVEYTSILHQAQKLVNVSGQDRFLASIVAMAPVWPGAVAKVDAMQAVENFGDMLGVDPRLIKPTEVAEAELAAQAAQVQQAQQAQQAQQVAGALQAAGSAPIAPDSALDRLMAGVRG